MQVGCQAGDWEFAVGVGNGETEVRRLGDCQLAVRTGAGKPMDCRLGICCACSQARCRLLGHSAQVSFGARQLQVSCAVPSRACQGAVLKVRAMCLSSITAYALVKISQIPWLGVGQPIRRTCLCRMLPTHCGFLCPRHLSERHDMLCLSAYKILHINCFMQSQ